MFGVKRTVETDGTKREVIADENYIINSIFNPNDDIVDGFNKGLMTDYNGKISDKEVKQFIEFIKSLDKDD